MKLYDKVVPINGHVLRSGAEWYPYAIVLSLDPFVLVSEQGDMRWSATIKPENFVSIGPTTWWSRRKIHRRKYE